MAKKMRHLKHFNTYAQYEAALNNNELSYPRVVSVKETNKVYYRPLTETFLLINQSTNDYLGTDTDTFLVIKPR